jgi:hypothetical protein
MKMFAAIFLLVIGSARAQSIRLLLIPVEATIEAHAAATFDVFVYNDSETLVNIPSLELFSAVYSFRDRANDAILRVENLANIATHAPPPHSLAPKSVEQRRIRLEIPANPGELVQVYVEIGRESVMRSNTVLLGCPVDSPKPKATPK